MKKAEKKTEGKLN